MKCRFYENKLPNVDDVVLVRIHNIDEMGVDVKLLEYNEIDGYVSIGSLSRKKIRHISKIVKVGKEMPLIVIRIDKVKGYIDLSKRDVSENEKKVCLDKFLKAKNLLGLVKKALSAIIFKNKLEINQNEIFKKCCQETIWKVYKDTHKNDPDEALKIILSSNYSVFDNIDIGLEKYNDLFKNELIKAFKTKYKKKDTEIEAKIELVLLTQNAVQDMKHILSECYKIINDETKLEINIISSPIYKLKLISKSDNEGLNMMYNILENIKETIDKKYKEYNNCNYKIIKQPTIIN